MACVTSLGLHSPAALKYLIAESLLPQDPSEDQYSWETYDDEGQEHGEHELVTTDHCVVWSQGGVTRRVFRFRPEEGKVLQAFPTWFAEHDSYSRRAATPGQSLQTEDRSAQSRAIVVIFKQQVNIYFFHGSSHVVSIPFEIDRAWPAPKGIILQRKTFGQLAEPPTPMPPAAPPNSFWSSKNQIFSSPTFPAAAMQAPRRKLSGHATEKLVSLADFFIQPVRQAGDDLPWLYTLSDPLKELGLVSVVSTSPVTRDAYSSNVQSHGISYLQVPDRQEELLYITPINEVPPSEQSRKSDTPLILAVTVNRIRSCYTVWSVAYTEGRLISTWRSQASPNSQHTRRKRRSTFGTRPSTRATTPGVRHHESAPENSFGGSHNQASFLAMNNHPGQTPLLSNRSTVNDPTIDFISTLQDDLVGLGEANASDRRTSSILARAELLSFDQNTFSDLARKPAESSFNTVGRRGASFGKSLDRGSIGKRRPTQHASLANSVPLSGVEENSLHESMEDELMAELDFSVYDEDVSAHALVLQEPFRGLKTELLMTKLSSFAIESPKSFTARDISSAREVLKVLTLAAPNFHDCSGHAEKILSMFVINQDAQTTTEIALTFHRREFLTKQPSCANTATFQYVNSREVQSHPAEKVVDAVKISDGTISRVLFLQHSSGTEYWLKLASNAMSRSCTHVPDQYIHDNTHTIHLPDHVHAMKQNSLTDFYLLSCDGMLKYSEADSVFIPRKLCHEGSSGKVDVVDQQGQYHRLQIHMQPRDKYVAKIMDIWRCIDIGLSKTEEVILTIWWQICRNLGCTTISTEWRALVVTLFYWTICHLEDTCIPLPLALAVVSSPVKSLNGNPFTANERYRAKASEESSPLHACASLYYSIWKWTESVTAVGSPSLMSSARQNPFIMECIKDARKYLATAREAGSVHLSDLSPVPQSQTPHKGPLTVARLIAALHLLREEEKLNSISQEVSNAVLGGLAPVLAQIGGWMGWDAWGCKEGSIYGVESPWMEQYLFEDFRMTEAASATYPGEPPSIYAWLESRLQDHTMHGFATIYALVGNGAVAGQGVDDLASKFTSRTTALQNLFDESRTIFPSLERNTTIFDCLVDPRALETLPEGVAAMLRNHMLHSNSQSSISSSRSILQFTDGEDFNQVKSDTHHHLDFNLAMNQSQDGLLNDVHYICHELDTKAALAVGIQEARNGSPLTNIIYRNDRAFWECLWLLDATRQQMRELRPQPGQADAAFFEIEIAQAALTYMRTMSLPSGDALAGYNCYRPLLTEHVKVTTFNTSCRIQPTREIVSVDKNLYTEERVSWSFFHAGVNVGLRIAREAPGIDTTWLVLNKPLELTNRHAGLLLALGLNGHLKSMAKWLAFKYLTPKHNMTSIGLLLGLSASHLGTMDTLVTRLLSVHVVRLLPPGAAELNVSGPTQTAGLMGVGLLYHNTQHRRMSEVMLTEIEHAELEDPAESPHGCRDEGYRVAAGFALGLINLGHGKNLHTLRDMRVVERLLSAATGPRDINLVHVIEQARAGATIAIALMFMKTQDQAIARNIGIPTASQQFDYIRPDILLLRVVAKNLIMWNDIQPTHDWLIKQLPQEYRRGSLTDTLDALLIPEPLRSTTIPAHGILAGACWSLSLKYAGTASTVARDVIIDVLYRISWALEDQPDRFRRTGYSKLSYDNCLASLSMQRSKHLLALSAATVMAGTGDIEVFKLLRNMHAHFDLHMGFGYHLATHQAIGALFLGQGRFTFGTSNLAVASLLCAFYPIFAMDCNDNRPHLQAFRHFWVFAAEARCLMPRDFETKQPIVMPIAVVLRDGTSKNLEAPCLLPELDEISRVETTSSEYWQVVLDFEKNPADLAAFKKHQSIFMRRKSLLSQYGSIFSATLAERTQNLAGRNSHPDPFKWLLNRQFFKEFGIHHVDLLGILPRGYGMSPSRENVNFVANERLLQPKMTKVDDMLVLVNSGGSRLADRLKDLSLLLAWSERERASGRKLEWINEEVAERLRAGVIERLVREQEDDGAWTFDESAAVDEFTAVDDAERMEID